MSITQTILPEVSFTSLNQRAVSLLIKTAVGGMAKVMSCSYSVNIKNNKTTIRKNIILIFKRISVHISNCWPL